jgi:peptide/nickel transport system permease protein
MIRFIIQRLLLAILVIVGAAIVIFTVMYFIPGDPAEILLGAGTVSPEDLANKKHELGLDQPFFVQLGSFMYNAFLRFDLGTSWHRGTPVIADIAQRLPRTFLLGV